MSCHGGVNEENNQTIKQSINQSINQSHTQYDKCSSIRDYEDNDNSDNDAGPLVANKHIMIA